MPRTFPSQLIAYLTSCFGYRESLGIYDMAVSIGKVVGFLELYDRLPDELIRLSPDEYAALVAAIGDIRFNTDQYRMGKNYDVLGSVGSSLRRAWGLIEKLKDEAPTTSPWGQDTSVRLSFS
jgi:hypothetical protein